MKMIGIEILLIIFNKDTYYLLNLIKLERWEAENDQLQSVTKSGFNIILIGIRRVELWEMGSNHYYQKNNNKTITKTNRN